MNQLVRKKVSEPLPQIACDASGAVCTMFTICMQGDDFNPGGTLTGGSRTQQRSTLAKVAEFEQIEAHLEKLQARPQLHTHPIPSALQGIPCVLT